MGWSWGSSPVNKNFSSNITSNPPNITTHTSNNNQVIPQLYEPQQCDLVYSLQMPCTMRLNKFKPYKNPKIILRGDTKKLTITSNAIRDAEELGYLISQMQSLWSSATLPKRDSWSRCQATSSTTAVCPVNTLLALITWLQKVIKTCFSMDPSPGLLPQFHLCPRDRVSGHRWQRVDVRSCLGSRTGHTYMAGSITWLLEMFSLICICVAPFQGPPSLNLDISQKHSTIMRIIEACKPYPSFLWSLKQKPGLHLWLCLWWSIRSLYHMMIL